MTREEKLAEIKQLKNKEMESFFDCVKMFLEARKECGVETDADFIRWITKNIKERRAKLEKMFREYERQFPD